MQDLGTPQAGATARLARGAAIAALMVFAPTVRATTVGYELTPLGADRYRYTYTVANDGPLGTPIEGISVLFDPAVYDESGLRIVTPLPLAAGWDERILGSGVLVPAAYDALALAGGIPVGGAGSGFAVEVTWLGPGLPGAQPFEIYDPATFVVLESGMTALVPEPGTLALLALGAGGLAGARRHSVRARRHAQRAS